MRKGGQAVIWGIGALLLAFGAYSFFHGYVDQNYSYSNARNISFIYVNQTLVGMINGSVIVTDQAKLKNSSLPNADYRVTEKCNSGTCTQTYTQFSSKPLTALLYYTIGIILLLFAVLSFYMAHKASR